MHKKQYFNFTLVTYLAIFLLSNIFISPELFAESKIPKVRHSVKSLNLTRVPTTKELMAAGQLGGQLYPTEDTIIDGKLTSSSGTASGLLSLSKSDKDKKIKKHEEHNLSFGKAIQKWNEHEYKQAVKMFRKHAKDYPDSAWVDESLLHVGCDARYNGRYTEAEDMFGQIITKNEGRLDNGAKMLLNKARSRLAILRMLQGNLEESTNLFRELKKDSPDWRHRSYASHWIQRLSKYKKEQLALLSCGTQALASLLKHDNRTEESREIAQIFPMSLNGHSMSDLKTIADRYGYSLEGLKLTANDLPSIPLPAIVQINRKQIGSKGHYWVLEKIIDNEFTFFDSQSGRRFHQTSEQFVREWDGNALIFSNNKILPGTKLSKAEMEETYGACCGVQRPQADLGIPSTFAGGNANQTCAKGAPVWDVNMISMNFYVTDIPIWYDPPYGPEVKLQLSYNSQDALSQNNSFGDKWVFNYGSYLTEDTGGNVTIFMPDGRQDVYTPTGATYDSPLGVFNTLTKIATNHYELELPDGTVYVYNLPNPASLQTFLVEIKDPYNQKLIIGYNGFIQIETITDATNTVILTFVDSNSNGLIDRVDDAFGRSAYFNYDANGNLTKITDMGGYWTELDYDPDVYMTMIKNAKGTSNIYIEPADGVVITDPYPLPGGDMWEYYRITITDPNGEKELYNYDGSTGYGYYVSPNDYFHNIAEFAKNFTDAPRTQYTFITISQNGRVSNIKRPAGGIESYTYDISTGNVEKITDFHGDIIQHAYNSEGNATSYTDAKGNIVTYEYYPNNIDVWKIKLNIASTPANDDILLNTFTYNGTTHNIETITDRLGNITELLYNTNGQLEQFTQAKGSPIETITDLIYNATTHNLDEIQRAANTVASFTYDNIGRIMDRTDQRGVTITNHKYSDLNQIEQITFPDTTYNAGNPDTKYIDIAYSSCCPRIIDSMTDRPGRTTTYIRDALNRVKEIQKPGGITKYDYDANGNLIELKDENSKITKFDYDLDNRLTKKTYADNKFVEYVYDETGLLKTVKHSRTGLEINYPNYDANHNLEDITYTDSTHAVHLTYDDYNNVDTMTDGIGIYDYGYDELNRLKSIDGPWPDDDITYEFNDLGQVKKMTAKTGPTTSSVMDYYYDYDTGYADLDLGRLKEIKIGTNTFTYGYSGVNSQIQSLTRPNGSITNYSYIDDLKRLTTIDNQDSTPATINKHVFTYNNLDVIDTETITTGTTLAPFTDDIKTYNHNNVNQLSSSTNPSQTFLYDDDGNMTQGYTPAGYQFTAAYDAENRLSTLTFNDGSNDYETRNFYSGDDFLARVEKWDDTVLPGTLAKTDEVRFVRAGFLPIQERNDSNTVVREYTWGLDKGGGIGGLLGLKEGGSDYYYLYDGKGNVMAVLNSAEAIVASYRYDEFGNRIKKTGTFDQPFQFSTKRYDELTGLSYYGYRFYSPTIGRWLTRDPLGEAGGINLYGFIGNSAVNYIDPLGLETIITIERGIPTSNSISGTVNVSSDKVGDTFHGYSLEPIRPKGPVPAGTYEANLRKDHSPWRVELQNVPKNKYIQMHVGNRPSESQGCFLVGAKKRTDRVLNSNAAMNSILNIIQKDNSGRIKVIVK